MPKSATPTPIRFKAKLLRPAEPANATWTFFVLAQAASNKLPTRSQVSVEGTLGGQPFQATLEPDGEGSHWLKVEQALADSAGAAAGDTVAVEMAPMAKEPEPKLPDDLREALVAQPQAKATWDDITAV
ncbi:MAG: DUF1905 domain-containing protein, partial [Pseudoxanthomonas sp.]|nr:DUF1905 domain-containing protein [Pseudoxanthomonas sp.]